MVINIAPDKDELGFRAGKAIGAAIRETLEKKKEARILLSTGSSQFETLSTLVKEDVDWSRVVMFHLDEYIGLPVDHKASFRGYLMERFISIVKPGKVFLVDGEGDIKKNIESLSAQFREERIDVGVIGIGENAHIAFNDPPADFESDEIYKIVTLDERCRAQQVGEGWFDNIEDVPKQAITLSVRAIMSARKIISAVPHLVKSEAVKNALISPISPEYPASILKKHDDWSLFLDRNSSSLIFPVD